MWGGLLNEGRDGRPGRVVSGSGCDPDLLPVNFAFLLYRYSPVLVRFLGALQMLTSEEGSNERARVLPDGTSPVGGVCVLPTFNPRIRVPPPPSYYLCFHSVPMGGRA